MRLFRNPVDVTKMGETAPAAAPGPVNKRQKGRIRAEMLQTSLGQAIDLSESGVKLERKGSFKLAPGATILISLNTPQRNLTCPARVAWVRKVGWFRSQVGLQFLDESETFRRSLRELCAACMDMRTFSADSEDLARRAG